MIADSYILLFLLHLLFFKCCLILFYICVFNLSSAICPFLNYFYVFVSLLVLLVFVDLEFITAIVV